MTESEISCAENKSFLQTCYSVSAFSLVYTICVVSESSEFNVKYFGGARQKEENYFLD